MAGIQTEDEVANKISPEERARILKSARQVAAYTNFMRWTANFRRDEVLNHPQHSQVMMLSPMQSGRFSFAIDGDTLLLGVQPFEEAWMSTMPFARAYLSDRLYLSIENVVCMDVTIPSLTFGIFVDDAKKREEMARANYVQPVRVTVVEGKISEVGRAFNLGFPLKHEDVIEQLIQISKERREQQDMSRFI
jgi:hypothetical protein